MSKIRGGYRATFSSYIFGLKSVKSGFSRIVTRPQTYWYLGNISSEKSTTILLISRWSMMYWWWLLFCLIFHFFDNYIYSLTFVMTTGSQFKKIHLSWQFPLPWKWWWMARAGYPWVATLGDTSHTMPRHRLLILSFLLRIAGRIRWFLCLCMIPHGTWSSSKSKFHLY